MVVRATSDFLRLAPKMECKPGAIKEKKVAIKTERATINVL
jgi:hypothetical protein